MHGNANAAQGTQRCSRLGHRSQRRNGYRQELQLLMIRPSVCNGNVHQLVRARLACMHAIHLSSPINYYVVTEPVAVSASRAVSWIHNVWHRVSLSRVSILKNNFVFQSQFPRVILRFDYTFDTEKLRRSLEAVITQHGGSLDVTGCGANQRRSGGLKIIRDFMPVVRANAIKSQSVAPHFSVNAAASTRTKSKTSAPACHPTPTAASPTLRDTPPPRRTPFYFLFGPTP